MQINNRRPISAYSTPPSNKYQDFHLPKQNLENHQDYILQPTIQPYQLQAPQVQLYNSKTGKIGPYRITKVLPDSRIINQKPQQQNQIHYTQLNPTIQMISSRHYIQPQQTKQFNEIQIQTLEPQQFQNQNTSYTHVNPNIEKIQNKHYVQPRQTKQFNEIQTQTLEFQTQKTQTEQPQQSTQMIRPSVHSIYSQQKSFNDFSTQTSEYEVNATSHFPNQKQIKDTLWEKPQQIKNQQMEVYQNQIPQNHMKQQPDQKSKYIQSITSYNDEEPLIQKVKPDFQYEMPKGTYETNDLIQMYQKQIKSVPQIAENQTKQISPIYNRQQNISDTYSVHSGLLPDHSQHEQLFQESSPSKKEVVQPHSTPKIQVVDPNTASRTKPTEPPIRRNIHDSMDGNRFSFKPQSSQSIHHIPQRQRKPIFD